jgi:hypothetical protein
LKRPPVPRKEIYEWDVAIMLEGNIPTLEAPHKQPSTTISNYEKWEKKKEACI